MRAARAAWPVSGGTIGDVSTTSSPGRLRGHDLLCAVAEGTAGAVGDAFLRGLVRHVAEAFGAKMVMVAEASDPTGMHVKVIACWYDGAYLDEPFEYDTAGTPCAVTTEYPWVTFPEALAERFPEDETVVELGLQSYLAVCLKSSEGVHLGHLAVLDSRPMDADEQDAVRSSSGATRSGGWPSRAHGWSTRPTRSAAASGATCTTAPSSGCSRSRTYCASRG
jgi:GAF domain